jgi:hypothetical protein
MLEVIEKPARGKKETSPGAARTEKLRFRRSRDTRVVRNNNLNR